MKKLVFLVLGIVAAGGCSTSGQDEQEAPIPTDGVTTQQLTAFDALQATTHKRWVWLQHAELKTPLHLSTGRTGTAVLRAGEDVRARTLSVLAENKALFKMRDPALELASSKTEGDDYGMTHARFQQVTHGVPVGGAEVMAHYDREGHLTSIDANYIAGLEDIDVNPRLTAADALAKVKADVLAQSVVDETTLSPDAGKLIVYATTNAEGKPAISRLAYEYRVHALAAERPAIWVVTVDAQNGDILDRYNNFQTVQASGKGVNGQVRQFQVSQQGASFVMNDASTGVPIQTFTAQQVETAPGNLVTSNNAATWDTAANGPGAAVDAHFNAGVVAKYYKTIHNRNAIDGVGGALQSTVHFGQRVDNAAWISTGMIYGDGDKLFRPLSASLDVVGHEFTHGVIEKTSNLTYKNQSGALNESVADIFGAFIEHSVTPDDVKNWAMGENVTLTGRPLRDAKTPGGVDEPQPAHMSQFVQTQQDEGGVHINSGIINNAAFLMTVGGKNPISGVEVKYGIGYAKSEKLWYQANAKYFITSTTFVQAAAGLAQAAKDVGLTPNETNIVDCAFKATGVVTGACATLTNPQSTTPGTGTPPAGTTPAPGDTDANRSGSGDDDEDDDSTPTKKKPTKRRAVQTETAGCSTTSQSTDLGPLAAMLGVLLALASNRRKKG